MMTQSWLLTKRKKHFRNCETDQLTDEVVGDSSHAFVRHDDPDDDQVAAGGRRGHRHEEHGPDELTPPW